MISIVVPVFNEEESLDAFYPRLASVMPTLDKNYEIIFIDDGSTDNSLTKLKKIANRNKMVKIFSFRKNQGKAEALGVGFKMAKGDYFITLDADLQDQPEEIQQLLAKAKEGYDLVAGWRKHRKDSFQKRIFSKLSNFLLKILWGIKLHDYNCGLKVYSKDAAKSLKLYGGMHRFIPLLVAQKGFTVTEIAVKHEQRKYGKSKYEFSKFLKDLPDLFTIIFLTKYGKRPLHFFGTIGSLLFLTGFIIFVYLWMIQLEGHAIGRRPLLFVSLSIMLAGLQIFFTGFLADLIIHTSQNFTLTEDRMESDFRYTTDKN